MMDEMGWVGDGRGDGGTYGEFRRLRLFVQPLGSVFWGVAQVGKFFFALVP